MKFFAELSTVIIAIGATFMSLTEEPVAFMVRYKSVLELHFPAISEDMMLGFPTFLTPIITVFPFFIFSLWLRKKDDWEDFFRRFFVYGSVAYLLVFLFSFVADSLEVTGKNNDLAVVIFIFFLVIVSANVKASLVIRNSDRWLVSSCVELVGICLSGSLLMTVVSSQDDFLKTWLGINFDLLLIAAVYFLPWIGIVKLGKFIKEL